MSDKNNNDSTLLAEETLLEFPCQFPIKVIGYAGVSCQSKIVDIVGQHASLIAGSIRSRPSRNQKYLAVSVTIEAQCLTQINAIYQDLTKQEWVVWAL